MTIVDGPIRKLLTTSVSAMALLISAEAHAQDTATQPTRDQQRPADLPADAPQSVEAGASDDEIIVMARRRAESLQDVPQTVTAVTGEQLEKLNIESLNDLDRVVTGLQLAGENPSMRGLTFNNNAVSGPAVATYINDAPVLPGQFFNSTLDIGQVEVLRGPVGTLRGIAAPSGALTLTTRRPDLNEFGGFVNLTKATNDGWNMQAAVGVPIIKDVLAVRIAGLFDYDDENGVRSVNSPRKPRSEARAKRISLRFEPTSSLAVNLMYQHFKNDGISFGSALFGSGAVGGVNPNAPPGYNGPVLARSDRRAVTVNPSPTDQDEKVFTGLVDWRIAGQKLSYVGSWARLINVMGGFADAGNMLLGFPLRGAQGVTDDVIKTHELRLSSEERVAGIFDYVVGVFHQKDVIEVDVINGTASFLSGAFGRPGPGFIPNPRTAPNFRYAINTHIVFPKTVKETSFFANVTAHIGDNLEISAGARRISLKLFRHAQVSTTPAFNAVAFNPALPCSLIPGGQAVVSPVYGPGVCDIPIPAVQAVNVRQDFHFKPWIYDAAISYHITPDLMVYAHIGSSWRQPAINLGINNATGDPALNELVLGGPEKSKSYEAGVKWSFLGGRGRLFVDGYIQKFDGLLFPIPGGVRYLQTLMSVGGPTPVSVNAPAKVKGFDIELGMRIVPQWDVSASFSWANGRVSGLLPCNDGNFDGVPDGIIPTPQDFISRGIAFATCETNTGSSTAPKWNLRVQSEYEHRITDTAEVFIRGLFAYQPKNPNASQTFVSPAYGLLDLFLGLRIPNKGFEVSVYGKNILDTDKVLNESAGFISPPANLRALFGDTGYRSVTFTPRREFGINARLAFGSR